MVSTTPSDSALRTITGLAADDQAPTSLLALLEAGQLTVVAGLGKPIIGAIVAPEIVEAIRRRSAASHRRVVCITGRDIPEPVYQLVGDHVGHLMAAEVISSTGEAVGLLASAGPGQEQPNNERFKRFRVTLTHLERLLDMEVQQEQLRLAGLSLKAAGNSLREDLRRLEGRNRELDLFADYTAHELKNPLRAIIATADYVAKELAHSEPNDDVDELVTLVRDISREASDMNEQINDLLALGKPDDAGETLVSVELDEVMEQILARYRTKLAGVGARVNVQPLPVVIGHRGHLKMVFSNLVSNAIRYRKANEPLVLDISSHSDGPDYFVVSVADNGRGVHPRDHTRIFAAYCRVDHDVAGIGLGLALCRRVVERIGGEIWVESQRGEGATFMLRLVAG